MLAFERPWALGLLALVPLLWLLDRFLGPVALAFPVEPVLPPPPRLFRAARAARKALVGLGLAALVAASAGPAVVDKRILYLSRGNEVVFALDLSPSMAAEDFAPSRLGAAKSVIEDFLKTRRNETVGLVAFGGEAALVCPPTLDYDSLASRLSSLVPGLYGEGTAIGAGIATALAHVERSGAPEKYIVLLTDGENNAGALDPATAASLAARRGVSLSVIGVGSPGEVPVSYVDPATGRRRSGSYRSGFDPAALAELALRGGGQYYAVQDRAALSAAFEAVAMRSASLVRARSVATEMPLARPLLLAALAALALARLIGLAGAGGRP